MRSRAHVTRFPSGTTIALTSILGLLAGACDVPPGATADLDEPASSATIASKTSALTPSNIGYVGACAFDYARLGKMPLLTPARDAEEALNTFGARSQEVLADWACHNDLTQMHFNQPGKLDAQGQFVGDPEAFINVVIAKLGFNGSCANDPLLVDTERAQRQREVNAALLSIATNGQQLGSTIEPGDNGLAHGRWGDLDPGLKELVLIPYLFPPPAISDAAYANVMNVLGTLSGPYATGRYGINVWDWKGMLYLEGGDALVAALFSPLLVAPLAILAGTRVSIDETENHMHMIESTRYLVNQLLARQQPTNPTYDNRANGLRDWWLTRLQSILKHDFQEYNAKPYARYSLDAIQNLAEFANDADLRTAAQMVLDFSAAKFAVSSSYLLRNSPFRRRTSGDTPDFLDETGRDEQMCRFALYSGQLDAFRLGDLPAAPSSCGTQLVYWLPGNCNGIVRQAVGGYRVPVMVLDLAMNKRRTKYLQTFNGGTNDFHEAPGGVEIYDNEGSYFIAAGGIPTGSGLEGHVELPWPFSCLNVNHETTAADDVGLAVPTVLMSTEPALIRRDRSQMIRFDGVPNHKAHHLCVGHGLACGDNPQVPDALALAGGLCQPGGGPRPCATVERQPGYWTPDGVWDVSFVQLSGKASNVFVAMWATTFQGWGNPVGFFEVADNVGSGVGAAPSLDYFKQSVRWYNPDGPKVTRLSNGEIDVRYVVSSTGGAALLKFGTPFRQYQVVDNLGVGAALSPRAGDTTTWAFADGPVAAPSHDGLVSITNPGYSSVCTLDLRDIRNPRRTGCESPVINAPGGGPPPTPPGYSQGTGSLEACTTCGPGGKSPKKPILFE